MTGFIERSGRLQKLPPYLFAEIDRLKRQQRAKGVDLIDLGVGDPDMPTPEPIVESMVRAVRDPANHRYALDQGMPALRQQIARWFGDRYGVELDPEHEILPLIGSKEGLAHLPLAIVNPGDEVLVPDPCYPPYRSATMFAGGVVYLMPLLEQNRFLPDFFSVDDQVAAQAKLMYLNYPNNPTAACVDSHFYERAVSFAQDNHILICQDAAYNEIYFDGVAPASILQVRGAKEVAIEFHSLSKTYNMTGWRIGFAVGNADAIAALAQLKSNLDSGIFQAVQAAAVAALEKSAELTRPMRQMYQERRDALVQGLNSLGWKVTPPAATFYVWVPVPPGYTSSELARLLLERCQLVVTPGIGFGQHGEGFLRFALTVPKDRLLQAVDRIRKLHH